jgi:hypothetical protein
VPCVRLLRQRQRQLGEVGRAHALAREGEEERGWRGESAERAGSEREGESESESRGFLRLDSLRATELDPAPRHRPAPSPRPIAPPHRPASRAGNSAVPCPRPQNLVGRARARARRDAKGLARSCRDAGPQSATEHGDRGGGGRVARAERGIRAFDDREKDLLNNGNELCKDRNNSARKAGKDSWLTTSSRSLRSQAKQSNGLRARGPRVLGLRGGPAPAHNNDQHGRRPASGRESWPNRIDCWYVRGTHGEFSCLVEEPRQGRAAEAAVADDSRRPNSHRFRSGSRGSTRQGRWRRGSLAAARRSSAGRAAGARCAGRVGERAARLWRGTSVTLHPRRAERRGNR